MSHSSSHTAAPAVLEVRHYEPLQNSDLHEHHQVVIGLAGRMEIALPGSAGEITARRGCVIPASVRHDYRGERRNSQLVLDLPVSRHTDGPLFDDARFFTLDRDLVHLVHFIAENTQRHPQRQALRLRGCHLLLDALNERLSPQRTDARRLDVARIDQFMRSRLDEPVTTAQLAGLTGLSPRRFHDCFVAAAGTTPYRYLLRLRLERAATLLRQNTMPLSDIALAVGFNDQSALTHAFRAAYGMPPAQWRKQAMA